MKHATFAEWLKFTALGLVLLYGGLSLSFAAYNPLNTIKADSFDAKSASRPSRGGQMMIAM